MYCDCLDLLHFFFFFFFNDTATTEIYTLSLHDALPISRWLWSFRSRTLASCSTSRETTTRSSPRRTARSEEHTSELQSQSNLVCRLLLEKKKTTTIRHTITTIRRTSTYSPHRTTLDRPR